MDRDKFCRGAAFRVSRGFRQRRHVRLIGRPHWCSIDMLMIAVTLMLVGVLLAACSLPWQQSSSSGNPGSAPPSTATLAPSPTPTPLPPTPTPTLPSPTPQFNTSASVDIDGLHIQTEPLLDGVECGGFLLLKQQQYAYADADLQQMRTYLSAFANATSFDGQNASGFYYSSPSNHNLSLPIPDTLSWIPGSDTCNSVLEFTNTGSENIQILSIGLTLDADSISNINPYQLIDICSALGLPYPPPDPNASGSCEPGSAGISGGPHCYDAYIHLHGGPAGTEVDTPITTGPPDPCSLPVTLDPTQPVEQDVMLHITSSVAQQLYRVHVSVTISTPGGTQTIVLPSSFTWTLTFTTPGQFSCYQLTGNTLSGEALPGDPTKYDVNATSFPCI